MDSCENGGVCITSVRVEICIVDMLILLMILMFDGWYKNFSLAKSVQWGFCLTS